MLSSEEAKELITLGRLAVQSVLRGREPVVPSQLRERFSSKRGVFTTLLTFPDKELRGCIGVPYPLYPLWQAVLYSSINSAFKDPRFPPLRGEELDKTIWELSILTEPKEVPLEELPHAVRVGVDGLMVELGDAKGLLLPQVPLRYGWSAVEFLENTCLKAGLSKDCWKNPDAKIKRFQSEVFEEVEPWGEVKRVEAPHCR